MKKYFILVLIIVSLFFINVRGVSAICSATTPWDCPGGVYGGSSSSSSSGSSSSCIDKCNNSDACKTAPNGQTCAQCKAQCQVEANEDKENWEDPTESFDSDATSNADDTLSDETQDNASGAQDLNPGLGYCLDLYYDDEAKKFIDKEKYEACVDGVQNNPEKYYDGEVDIESIVEWASSQGYDVNSIGEPCDVISPKLESLLNTIFWAISIIGVILVVVMTALSFVKAIIGSDDEKFRDAFRHLFTRIIVVIVLLLLPAILSFIITLINDSSTGEVTIGEDGNVFCDIAN